MRKPGVFITASMIASTMLMISVPGEARNRPTVGPSDPTSAYDICLTGGGDTNAGTGGPDGKCPGAICYCCYDDGCFICNNVGGDCTWDPKARARTVKQRLKGLPDRPSRATTVNPGPATRPPRNLEPGLLEGGGSLSTQGPAATGRPVAPPPPPPGQLR